MYKKILLAMDSSDDAQRAAQKAIEFKKQWDSEVIAFHSTEHHFIPQEIPLSSQISNFTHYSIPPSAYNEIEKVYKEHGKEILKNLEDNFAEEELDVETRLISVKRPAQYIIETVEKENIDLVILGCKGAHSKLKEVFIGSVAQSVVNKAPCDVLVVR
ncbi:MAG: hypothetical protein GF311_13075 [Candidatus Lokiarchaeota archaeon]|nr:hypothetical protein [Candidatus Lokiarchaeota archaeon]